MNGIGDQRPVGSVTTADLVAGYEDMRREFVDGGGAGHRGRGVALFLRHGMAAWMEVLGSYGGNGDTGRDLTVGAGRRADRVVSNDIRQEIVRLLAAMVISRQGE